MTPDTIAIIAVGIALGGLMLQLARNTNRRFDDVNRRFDDFNQRFDDFKNSVNQRFDDFNQRFDDFKNEVNRRFDDVDRRFDDAARRNEAAHAQIASNISELRADFRSVIPRAAAERPNRAVAADRDPID